MVKACPTKAKPWVTLAFGTLFVGGVTANNYIDKMVGGGPNVGQSTGGGPSDTPDNTPKGVSKYVQEELSDIVGAIKELLGGTPIRCEGSSWGDPVEKINNLLVGYTNEEGFFVGIIIMLIGVLLLIMLVIVSVAARLMLDKPLENKFLEKVRVRWVQGSNLTLLVILIAEVVSVIYIIYLLSLYAGFIQYR